MPRRKAATGAGKLQEPAKPFAPEPQVNLDEYAMEDEIVEYEEIEEVEEIEEEVEEVEEEEEAVEEKEEEEEEEELIFEEVEEKEEEEEELIFEEVEEEEDVEEDEDASEQVSLKTEVADEHIFEEVEEEEEMEDEDADEQFPLKNDIVDEHFFEEVEEEEEAGDEDAGQRVSLKNEIADDERKKHAALLALPPHGSEVYIGGIPPDLSQEDLKIFCGTIGEVVDVRIMKDKDSSKNKGYAFVTFKTKELAAEAIKKLNDLELKKKKLKCSPSQAKNRLFIGKIPKNLSEDSLRKALMAVCPGITRVQLSKDPKDPIRNRGFAFIEYYNHSCAEYSRNKISDPDFKINGTALVVSWADLKNGEALSTSQVKALYVKNIPRSVTDNQLRKLFEPHGMITKIVMPSPKAGHDKRYAFVHFKERYMALNALYRAEKFEIKGDVLDCSLAKPQGDKKVEARTPSTLPVAVPSQYPPIGYGVMPSTYVSLSPGFFQPTMYGVPPVPSSMSMVPMVLPDGRVGYVMPQQPVGPTMTQQHHHHQHHYGGRGRRNHDSNKTGNSGGSGWKSNQGINRGRKFRPY